MASMTNHYIQYTIQSLFFWGCAEDRTQGLGAGYTTELYPSPQSLSCGLKTQVRCIHLATSWTSQSIRLPARIISSLFSYSAKQYLCIDFLLNRNILQLSSPIPYVILCLMSPWRNVFLWQPMSKGSDPGYDQFYFSLQDSAHLVLYHAYLCFFIFGSIPNERKYFIFIWIRTWTFCARKQESCIGNYLESNILFFREPWQSLITSHLLESSR